VCATFSFWSSLVPAVLSVVRPSSVQSYYRLPGGSVGVWFGLKLWVSLYLMVWLAFLEIILVWGPASGIAPLAYAHVVLGVLVFAIAYSNSSKLRKTDCPARVKRIVKATVALAAFEGLLGIVLYVSKTWSLPDLVTIGVGFLHLGTALAIVTQAASTATAYDIWEEKEFT
jgi:hypothetical protein